MNNKIARSSITILSGDVANQLLTLTRNVLIARLIGPDQFGIGLTFAVAVSFLEMATDVSWDKFVVQDRHGDAKNGFRSLASSPENLSLRAESTSHFACKARSNFSTS